MLQTTVNFSLDLDGRSRQVKFDLILDPDLPVHAQIGRAFEQNSFYKAETSRLISGILREGDTFIDVGAHIGYFSLLAASLVGPGGFVYAIEPENRNFDWLIQHARINRFGQLLPLHLAVGAENTVADLFINSDNDGGHALWDVAQSLFNQKSREQPKKQATKVVRLDSLFHPGAPPSLRAIKISTEGADHMAIQGMLALIEHSEVPYVIVEINSVGLAMLGSSIPALANELIALGYEIHEMAEDTAGVRKIELSQVAPLKNYGVYNLVFIRP